MAFSGQKLSFASGPDELIPVASPTSGEPTTIVTYANGTAVMTATSAGLSIAQSGPRTNLSTPVTPAMSPYSVGATDVTLLCSTSSAISVVLPTAASGTYRVVQVVDASGAAASNNITVTVSGGGTINGAASYVINFAYGTATFMSTGAFWVVIDNVVSSGGGGGGGGYATGVRQVVTSTLTARVTTTTAFLNSSSVPDQTQGAEALTATITPQSATSNLLVLVNSMAGVTTGAMTTCHAIYRDAGSAIGATATYGSIQNATFGMCLTATVASGSTSSTTFRYRYGPAVNTVAAVLNGNGSTQYFGTAASTRMTVIEYGA